MAEYARRLLDTLMGEDRDVAQQYRKQRHWSEEAICKNYLIAVCPNDLFTYTRSDFGPCTQLHDQRAKAEFDATFIAAKEGRAYQTQNAKYQMSARDVMQLHGEYETAFFYQVREILRELDRKMRRGRERLGVSGNKQQEVDDEERALAIEREDRNEKIVLLEARVKQLTAEIERCGDEGLIDEAQQLDEECGNVAVQLQGLRAEEAKEKRMDVCAVCGSLLIQNDVEDRVRAHLAGKQHTGYKLLRDYYASLQEKYEGERRRKYEREERDKLAREQASRQQQPQGGQHQQQPYHQQQQYPPQQHQYYQQPSQQYQQYAPQQQQQGYYAQQPPHQGYAQQQQYASGYQQESRPYSKRPRSPSASQSGGYGNRY